MFFTYTCDSRICSKQISFGIFNDRITLVQFQGGCQGNLRAISALLEGMFVNDAIEKLKLIACGNKGTSCAADLAKALKEAV